jgi:hypothetical protein
VFGAVVLPPVVPFRMPLFSLLVAFSPDQKAFAQVSGMSQAEVHTEHLGGRSDG